MMWREQFTEALQHFAVLVVLGPAFYLLAEGWAI